LAAALQTLRRLEEAGYQRDLDRFVAWGLYEQHALALRARHGAPHAELRNRLDVLAERYRDQHGCAWSEIWLASLLAKADFAFEHTRDASCVAQIEDADLACRALGRQLLSVRLSFMRATAILRSGEQGAVHQEHCPRAEPLVRHGEVAPQKHLCKAEFGGSRARAGEGQGAGNYSVAGSQE
jgi:hypothetical protein